MTSLSAPSPVLSDDVADALAAGFPVVALETTVLAHGFPRGRNLQVAHRLEAAVRDSGAVPATIAVLDGQMRIGLTPAQLERICGTSLPKLSLRDLGPALALGRSGATTVAGTATLAQVAGIKVFATGGLGGVHHPLPGSSGTWDVSADLGTLARTGILVVCSGMKSILDIPATLEVLETNSVPVLGYRTEDFPAFYLRSSGLSVPHRVDDPAQAAAVLTAHRRLADSAVVLANPIPPEFELDAEVHNRLLTDGLEMLHTRGVQGPEVTPVLLEHFHEASRGASLDANEALVLANARLAAAVAAELAR